MTRRSRMIGIIVDRWIERFGEPPPIRTDPELMRTILEACEARPTPSRELAGAPN